MTDLERAREDAYERGFRNGRREGAEGAEAAVIAARKNEYAAGYRRGAEETEARLRSSVLFEVGRREGAEEMRERLITALRNECECDQSFVDLAGPNDWERVIRAIPLTPEEPA